jgi:CDP-diacylglycerol--serine O-phosphatidyltransferase
MSPHSRLFFIPNSVTAANIVVGFVSMLAAADGRFDLAVYLLVCAVLLDMSDGLLARKLHVTSKFGQEMDSLSDSLSFCAAPAFLVHQAMLKPLGGFGVAIAITYVLAGVFRLARFNLISDEHEKGRWTTGVPTPIGAGYIMALVLMRGEVPLAGAVTLVLVLAMLMVSRWHLPELKGSNLVSSFLLIGMCTFFGVVFWPSWTTIGIWNAWNLVILLAARAEAKRDAAPEALL